MKPIKNKIIIVDNLKYKIISPKIDYSIYDDFTKEHFSANLQLDLITKKSIYLGNYFDYVYYPVGTFYILRPKLEHRDIEVLNDIIIIKPIIINKNRNIYINV